MAPSSEYKKPEKVKKSKKSAKEATHLPKESNELKQQSPNNLTQADSLSKEYKEEIIPTASEASLPSKTEANTLSSNNLENIIVPSYIEEASLSKEQVIMVNESESSSTPSLPLVDNLDKTVKNDNGSIQTVETNNALVN